jgi:chemotaxis protein MotA
MGLGSIVGVVAGFAAVFVSMIMEGGNPASLIAPPALILILVGTFGAACGGTSLEGAVDALKSAVTAFTAKGEDRVAVVTRLTEYGETARQEGLLALEDKARDEEHEVLAAGLQSLVDGGDTHATRQLVEAMALSRKKVWDERAEFYNKMGGYAPTLGIIGTVLGLIHTLESLGGDPSSLGHLIAAAFIATFFGVTFANLVFLPIGAKLKLVGADQLETSKVILVGLTMIADGSGVRALRSRLAACLPPSLAAEVLEEAA